MFHPAWKLRTEASFGSAGFFVSADKEIAWFVCVPTLERTTYNCPWGRHHVSRSKPHNSKDWHWALLMIANANRIGNCNLLNWNGISVGIIGMRGMTSLPLKDPIKIDSLHYLIVNTFLLKRQLRNIWLHIRQKKITLAVIFFTMQFYIKWSSNKSVRWWFFPRSSFTQETISYIAEYLFHKKTFTKHVVKFSL